MLKAIFVPKYHHPSVFFPSDPSLECAIPSLKSIQLVLLLRGMLRSIGRRLVVVLIPVELAPDPINGLVCIADGRLLSLLLRNSRQGWLKLSLVAICGFDLFCWDAHSICRAAAADVHIGCAFVSWKAV